MKRKSGLVTSIDELKRIIQNTPMISPGLPVGWDEALSYIEAKRVFDTITQTYPESRLVTAGQDTSYYAKIVVQYLQEPSVSRSPTVILSMIGRLSTIQDSQFLNPEYYEDLVNTLVSLGKKFVPYDLFGPHQSDLLGWDGSPSVEFTHENLWRSLFDYF